jgi:hypothetical protein
MTYKTVPALWLGEIMGYLDLTEAEAHAMPQRVRSVIVNHIIKEGETDNIPDEVKQ